MECAPGSQQARHRHLAQEQVYVIVGGQGQMLLGDEGRAVSEGTLVCVPPGTEHAIRNTSSGLLVCVPATAPPFTASIAAGRGCRVTSPPANGRHREAWWIAWRHEYLRASRRVWRRAYPGHSWVPQKASSAYWSE